VRVLFSYFALPWIRAQQVEAPHSAEVVVEGDGLVVTVQNET
jgi:hypothetical protein